MSTETFDTGDAGPLEIIWRIVKVLFALSQCQLSLQVLFALSPLIGMLILFIMSYDDDEKEKEKRNEVYEFQLAGAEE